uniref:Deoxyribonuclease II n=1 Tax=Panagrolaimus superbus TaxID=310955 RepID=A0A914YCQ5_9BILA
MEPFYSRTDILKLAYTDQIHLYNADGNDGIKPISGCGHIKGMIFFANGHGVWIIHSVPGLPIKDKNRFPTTSSTNAQHVVCMNINETMLAVISEHLFDTRPYYETKIIPAAYLHIGHLRQIEGKAVKKDSDLGFSSLNLHKQNEESVLISEIHSRCNNIEPNEEGVTLKSFWDEVVDSLRSNNEEDEELSVLLQTWTNSKDRCRSKEHHIKDVTKTTIIEDEKLSWTSGSDHAKYGISTDDRLLFFGDLNHTVINFDPYIF